MTRAFFTKQNLKNACFGLSMLSFSSSLFGFFVDGSGHYGVRGFTLVNPGASPKKGIPQAIEQTFRLEAEVRSGDHASFFGEFRLFTDPRNAYLGDTSQPSTCNGNENCSSKTQSLTDPGYSWYTPKVTEFYLRYAFDYCILQAGRYPKDWGMGMFLDSGKRPFSISSSFADGINCSVNLQKFQDLTFNVGYDKLTETGFTKPTPTRSDIGASKRADDIDQIYVSVELDDRKTRPGSSFNKQIGIYAAKISSGEVASGGLNTELSIADLYLGFYFPQFSFRSEFLMYLGSSSDPNSFALGGADKNASKETAKNSMNSIAFAGSMEWLMSGSPRTPQEAYLGSMGSRHISFFDYAFAPGDSQGYYNDTAKDDTALSSSKRSENARAMALNSNFKPALILFNGRSNSDNLRVDGIFDPTRIMNAQVFGLGYRFENKDFGNLESKVITAFLNQSIPDDAKAHYSTQTEKVVGYYGKNLGYELDLKYWKTFSGGIDVGLSAGALVPGLAWQISDDQPALNSYLLQAHLIYNF